MATQIFDNDFLHTHPIYQNVHSTLVDVSNRDYAMAPFDKRIECLDMDDYEAHYMQNDANDSTMDAVIGIANYDNNHKSGSSLLMVELRLGYQSAKNITALSLNNKVKHTMTLLNAAEFPISQDAVFIFKADVCQQAKHKLDALGHSNTSRRRWIVMSPDIFGKAYIAKEDIPYVPLHDYKAVLANFCRLIDSHLWDEVEKEFESWGSKTYSRISYISQERELLEDMLRNVWIKIESEKDKVDADTWDYISLIKEDYPHILG